MSIVLWVVLVGGAFAAGAAIVGVLVLPRNREPIPAAAGILAFAASGWAFARIGAVYERADVLAYALGLAIGGLGGGYALVSALLERLGTPERLPHLHVGPEVGHARVILACCGEPARYELRSTTRELSNLQNDGLLELTIGVTPFMYAAQKARYRAIGGSSPARSQAHALAEQLDARLDRGRFDRVDVAWCDDLGSLAQRVAAAAAHGCRTIVVVTVAVADSADIAQAKRAVDQMRPEDAGVSVFFTPPAWSAETIAVLQAERVLAVVDRPEQTGVLLLAHGQPEVHERTHTEFDRAESAFASRIRLLLAERGIQEKNVLTAWAEWRDPDVATTIRHLAALGCTRIVVLPACFPFDGFVTRLDVPMGVRQARIDPSVSVVTLNAWIDDASVVDVLENAVRAAIPETPGTP